MAPPLTLDRSPTPAPHAAGVGDPVGLWVSVVSGSVEDTTTL